MTDGIPPIRECCRLADDELSAIIVPVLRRDLPLLLPVPPVRDDERWAECTVLLGLWRRCWEHGMHELLTIVALQVLFKDRNILSIEIFLSQGPLERLLHPPIFQPRSPVYWRIYLEVLRVLLWAHRRSLTPTEPGNRLSCDTLRGPIVGWLLGTAQEEAAALAGLANDPAREEVIRILVTFIHQLYLEAPNLITSTEPYDLRLLPWMIEFAPSTHVLMEKLPERLRALTALDPFLLRTAALLAIKYPIPASLGLCQVIADKCHEFGGSGSAATTLSDVLHCLRIALLVMTAFPSLMPRLAPLLVQWNTRWTQDESFRQASQAAISTIAAITAAVNAPIYRRPALPELVNRILKE